MSSGWDFYKGNMRDIRYCFYVSLEIHGRGRETIIEFFNFAGESSSGKTQLCLQVLVNTVCLSHAHAVYFHTEGDPPLHRLEQIAKSMIEKWVIGVMK